MFKKSTLTIICLSISIVCYSQIDQLIVPKYIKLPGDSIQNEQLVSSIAGFLKQAAKFDKDNAFVLKENILETSALLDEIKGIENGNGNKMNNFFKCYLASVVSLDSANYVIQISYIGINELAPVLRASFKLMAKKMNGQYFFYSPLKRNTITWQVKKEGNFIFYYKTSINSGIVNNYVKKAEEFDKKLHAADYTTQIYYCDDFQTALELLGVEYKLDYNGVNHNTLSTFDDNNILHIVGSNDLDIATVDIHDLWHERLNHTISINIINKSVNEGCAYLYGGSWGISWHGIFKKFKAYMGSRKDWLTAFNENNNFGDSQKRHLYVSYVINALIIKQIEKENGFNGVIKLLSCGKIENDNANYFHALNKIIGINKSNFNEKVERLFENEK